MMLNKIIIQILDFLIKIFTFLRKYFLRNNQEVKVIKLTRITYNNNLSCLNFFFNNNGNIIGSEEILKSIYYQLISQDEYINLGQYKVLMLIGSYKGIEFTYHHNILVNNTTSFEEYYAAIKNNIFKLYSEGYEVHNVEYFNMRVWNMDSVQNKKIKISNTTSGNKLSSLTIKGIRSFSTNTKFKKRIEITPIPVKAHHKNIVNTFAAIDIETVENPVNSGNQTPIAISLVFKDLNNNMQKKFFINKDENQLFVSFFNYLNSEEFLKNNVLIIFAHNLGNFDGLFLLRGLLKVTDNIKDIDTLIDHHNKFILIKYKNIVFKDSFRIFPVSLNDLCLNFEVSGKTIDYNEDFNNLQLFLNKELLNKFKDYSINDSVCLFNALTVAQNIYLINYQVDITTIYSTSTLSLRIFRQHHLLFPIPILEVNQDKFIRFSYFGGATDYYFVSLRYSKVVLFFIF